MRLLATLLLVPLLYGCSDRDGRPAAGSRADTALADALAPHNEDPVGDSILVERYSGGALRYLVLAMDSEDCKELHQTFYGNGALKSQGCQGTIANAELRTGMSVGIWTFFDSSSGRIDSTLRYNNGVASEAFIEKRVFFPDGSLKAVETYNNYILYETEPRRKGLWKYYAEDGRLLRSQSY